MSTGGRSKYVDYVEDLNDNTKWQGPSGLYSKTPKRRSMLRNKTFARVQSEYRPETPKTKQSTTPMRLMDSPFKDSLLGGADHSIEDIRHNDSFQNDTLHDNDRLNSFHYSYANIKDSHENESRYRDFQRQSDRDYPSNQFLVSGLNDSNSDQRPALAQYRGDPETFHLSSSLRDQRQNHALPDMKSPKILKQPAGFPNLDVNPVNLTPYIDDRKRSGGNHENSTSNRIDSRNDANSLATHIPKLRNNAKSVSSKIFQLQQERKVLLSRLSFHMEQTQTIQQKLSENCEKMDKFLYN